MPTCPWHSRQARAALQSLLATFLHARQPNQPIALRVDVRQNIVPFGCWTSDVTDAKHLMYRDNQLRTCALAERPLSSPLVGLLPAEKHQLTSYSSTMMFRILPNWSSLRGRHSLHTLRSYRAQNSTTVPPW